MPEAGSVILPDLYQEIRYSCSCNAKASGSNLLCQITAICLWLLPIQLPQGLLLIGIDAQSF